MKKLEELEHDISGYDILPDLLNIKKLFDFSSVRVSEKEKQKKLAFINSLKTEKFRNIEELCVYVYKWLPSTRVNFQDRLFENIQSYLVFRPFLVAIEGKKSEKKYTALNSLVSKFYNIVGKIRPKKEAESLHEAVKLYSTRNEWSNLFRENSGNFFRSLSMKYLEIEPINLLRVVRRTIDRLNPFSGVNEINLRKKKNDFVDIDIKKKLVFVVYCFLSLFYNDQNNNNPALLYVLFLMKYGFKISKKYINEKSVFDVIYCKGLARYLFFYHKKEYKQKKELFVELCFKNEKKSKSIITFEDIKFNSEDLKFSEVKMIRSEFFDKENEEDLTVEQICRKKEELLREEKKRVIFEEYFDELVEESKQTFDMENSFELIEPPTPIIELNKTTATVFSNNNEEKTKNEDEENGIDLNLYSKRGKSGFIEREDSKLSDSQPKVFSIDLKASKKEEKGEVNENVEISQIHDEPTHLSVDLKKINLNGNKKELKIELEEVEMNKNKLSPQDIHKIEKEIINNKIEENNDEIDLKMSFHDLSKVVELKKLEDDKEKNVITNENFLTKSESDLTKVLNISPHSNDDIETPNIGSEIFLSPLDSIFEDEEKEKEKEEIVENIEKSQEISIENNNSENNDDINNGNEEEDWLNPEKLPSFIRSKIEDEKEDGELKEKTENDSPIDSELDLSYDEIQKMIINLEKKNKEKKKNGWIKPDELSYPEKLTTSEYEEN